MTTQTTESPLSQPVQAVLDLFAADLAEVRFPDIDQRVLQEAARRVQEAAEEQARLEARLQAAREARQEAEDALLQKCHRALAYARVYAEDDADLGRRLDAVGLPRARGKAAPPLEAEGRPERRRGRRGQAASGGLFIEVAVAEPGMLPARPSEAESTPARPFEAEAGTSPARAYLERPEAAVEARP